MRHLLLFLLLLPFPIHAQRCGGKHTLEVRMPRPVFVEGRWMASAELDGARGEMGSVDSVPGDPYLLRMRLRTGCGLDRATWTIHDHHSAGKLTVNLYHLPGNEPSLHLRIPFAGYNTQHFDLRTMGGCAAVLGRLREGDTDTIACRGGLGVYTALGYDGRFEVLNTRPWEAEPRPIAVVEAGDASFLGGERALELHLRTRISKALIETLPAAHTFHGQAMVEADGTVHDVSFSTEQHPTLQKAIRRALQLDTHWQPAAVAFQQDDGTTGFRAVRAPYMFQFTADPATVWIPLVFDANDLQLPTPTTGGQLTLRWVGGSCGQDRHVVMLGSPRADGCTDIDMSAGVEGDMCQDIRQRSQTVPLPPLPPGCYRLRIVASPPGTTSHTGPYQFVAFTVGP